MQTISTLAYILVAFVMYICDAVWIFFLWNFYSENIQLIQQGTKVNICKLAIAPIYVIMYLSVIFIAIPLYPEYNVGAGTLVGGAIYGVYDLCMVLQFEDNNLLLAVFDTLWGMALFTGLTYLAISFS